MRRIGNDLMGAVSFGMSLKFLKNVDKSIRRVVLQVEGIIHTKHEDRERVKFKWLFGKTIWSVQDDCRWGVARA